METCPCGNARPYTECCEPVITGTRPAATPEELMRARYTAHVKAEIPFIGETLHPDHRQGYDAAATKEWAEKSEWLGLEIISSSGGAGDATGEVEFIARFREKGIPREHHELASFRKDNGIWYFTDGKMVKATPLTANKVGRNDPCTCGSGAKYKKCCGK